MRKRLDERVYKGYYSSTKSGRTVFYRYIERFASFLEVVTDEAH